MNIFKTDVGSKVVYIPPKKGFYHEVNRTSEYLTVGKTYTISKIDICGFNTDIYLEEVPGVKFNSMMFDDAA